MYMYVITCGTCVECLFQHVFFFLLCLLSYVFFFFSLTATFEPPLLTVTACNQSLCISLGAPADKLYSIYNSFKFYYRLMVSSEDRAEVREQTCHGLIWVN